MKKILAALLASASLAALPLAIPAAAGAATCPPGSTNPDYCTGSGSSLQEARKALATVVKILKKSGILKDITHSGSVKLKVTAPGKGTYTIIIKAKVGGKTLQVASGSHKFSKSGSANVTVKAGPKGKAYLKKHTKVKVTVTVIFRPTVGSPASASETFTLH
jgi:hypothetical protein